MSGLSYGTYLGQTYANLFPHRVRAMLLDGVVDPVRYSKSAEARMAMFVRPSRRGVRPVPLACARAPGPERCALAGGKHTAAERFERLLARVKRAPIPAPGANGTRCRPSR